MKQCLHAEAEGPFFPDWEFATLMGVNRDIVQKVDKDWPERTVSPMDFRCAVLNTLNNLTGYPHQREDAWGDYIPASPDDVRILLDDLIAKKVFE